MKSGRLVYLIIFSLLSATAAAGGQADKKPALESEQADSQDHIRELEKKVADLEALVKSLIECKVQTTSRDGSPASDQSVQPKGAAAAQEPMTGNEKVGSNPIDIQNVEKRVADLEVLVKKLLESKSQGAARSEPPGAAKIPSEREKGVASASGGEDEWSAPVVDQGSAKGRDEEARRREGVLPTSRPGRGSWMRKLRSRLKRMRTRCSSISLESIRSASTRGAT